MDRLCGATLNLGKCSEERFISGKKVELRALDLHTLESQCTYFRRVLSIEGSPE